MSDRERAIAVPRAAEPLRVVIIGGGFAGLHAARAFARRSDVSVTVERCSHMKPKAAKAASFVKPRTASGPAPKAAATGANSC